LLQLGSLERGGSEGLWQLFIDNDPGNPEKYVMFIEQGGLGLPDESYYRDDSFQEIRTRMSRTWRECLR
jgi:putative endopeptidase